MNPSDKNYNFEHYRKEDAYLRAQKRLKELKGFYGHAFWYVVVNLFIIIMIAFNSRGDIWHFGTFSTAFFWGIGLAFNFKAAYFPLQEDMASCSPEVCPIWGKFKVHPISRNQSFSSSI